LALGAIVLVVLMLGSATVAGAAVSIESPASGSVTVTSSGTQALSGSAGTAKNITVQLFSGTTTQPPADESLTVPAPGGTWSAVFGGLSPGTYTALAEASLVEGGAMSAPVTFTIQLPTPPSPPNASFTWFPAAPKTGEAVSLVSNSIDISSPITAFAWDPSGTGAFQGGGPVFSTSFPTPGAHVVHLRVTNASGLSSLATQTIQVVPAPLVLMEPFPVVRFAGSRSSFGIKLSLLTVQAPLGALVSVTCSGRGCPIKSESESAFSSNSKGGTALFAFHRFERSLRAGVTLEVRVSKAGEVGKYTRFKVRRGRLPVRVDGCLGPTGVNPIVCPSS
jgi:hypothetical protein